jgi:hypothetical protein
MQLPRHANARRFNGIKVTAVIFVAGPRRRCRSQQAKNEEDFIFKGEKIIKTKSHFIMFHVGFGYKDRPTSKRV